ncbi:MAG: hypothetical protein JSR18_14610 [Proteobacteria bacterium]|nr:hypothetical protein [Pseudomonadota bacterium]
MAWRERSAWISLVSTCLIFGIYFWHSAGALHDEVVRARPFLVNFLVAAVAATLINGGLHVVSAITGGIQRADERDAALEARAFRIAYGFLLGTLLCAFSFVALLGAIQSPSAAGTVLLPTFTAATQFALLVCVAAELLRNGMLIAGYRRGG